MSANTKTTTKITTIQKGLLALVTNYEQAILKEQEIKDCDSLSTSSSEGENETQVTSLTKSESEFRKILKKYCTILNRLQRVKIEDSVFVYCSLLFKKVMSKRKSTLQARDLLKIFTVCIFLSFKYVVDDLLFYAKDFCTLTGIDPKMLEMLESAILVNILNFEINFSEEEFN